MMDDNKDRDTDTVVHCVADDETDNERATVGDTRVEGEVEDEAVLRTELVKTEAEAERDTTSTVTVFASPTRCPRAICSMIMSWKVTC